MGEKTEAPTPRHLAEMREQGEIGMSVELVGAIALVVAIYMLPARMVGVIDGLVEIMRNSFESTTHADLTLTTIQSGGNAILAIVAREWLPFLLTVCGAGLAAGFVQTRGAITLSKVRPTLKHLNPLSGVKRMFSGQAWFETGKGLLKIAILGTLLYSSLRDVPGKLAMASQADLRPALTLMTQSLTDLARQAANFLLLAAGIDFIFQRRQHMQRLKMSREEIQEELKSAEGQPLVKAKIRQLQRRWSRQRMMQQIVHSDVVVTNPTHLAIALRYDRTAMSAPVVLAKGQDLVAAEIVRRAREAHIPIVQNIPLAHALIHVELNAQIPADLYQAVAEVLAFVYRLRRLGGLAN